MEKGMPGFAIVKIKGSQYKVTEGQEIVVDRFTGDLSYDVLLVVKEGKLKLGNPTLKKTDIKFKILNEVEKGSKIDVVKYKAKSRYRKKIGFRPQHTRLLVEKISD